MDALVQALALGVWYLRVQLELLIVREKLLCIFRGLVVPLSQFPDVGVHLGNAVDVLLALDQHAVELPVLLVDQPLESSDAILSYVLRQLLGSARLSMAVLFEALHFAAQQSALNGVLIPSSLRNAVKVLGIDVLSFNTQAKEMNNLFYLFLPLGIVLPLHLQILKEWEHRSRARAPERVEG